MATFTKDNIGCYFDGARGIYIGEAIQEMAEVYGWDAWAHDSVAAGVVPTNHDACDGVAEGIEGHSEIDHGQHYSEATDEAEDYLNTLTDDDVAFGPSEAGDWGLWHLCDDDLDCEFCESL